MAMRLPANMLQVGALKTRPSYAGATKGGDGLHSLNSNGTIISVFPQANASDRLVFSSRVVLATFKHHGYGLLCLPVKDA